MKRPRPRPRMPRPAIWIALVTCTLLPGCLRTTDEVPAMEPSPERCDPPGTSAIARDNDWDDRVDEDEDRPGELLDCCTAIGDRGACGLGVCASERECLESWQWSRCPGEDRAEPERCDGLDNDCDGRTDEGVVPCECVPGTRVRCGVDVGECTESTQVCSAEGRLGPCPGLARQRIELCDGLDNDCDGRLDEGLPRCPCVPERDTQVCGETNVGACSFGLSACDYGATGQQAQWGACEGAVLPAAETCDGRDEDCDGRTDELPQCECVPGARAACGVPAGACFESIRICDGDGRWGPCPGLADQAAEVCDGVDNDCDGTADEDLPGCECVPGSQQPCGVEAGVCFASTRTCGDDGHWGPCPGLARQTAESCDGVDQDCDGQADEALPRCECEPETVRQCGESSTGECRFGVQRCEAGAPDEATWSACQGAVLPMPERCDGRDDDCDGRTDERPECECVPGRAEPCGIDAGVCFRSERICGPDGTWGACPGAATQAAEQCDGLDNDCDGRTDEAVAVCECIPDARRPCGVDVGVCFESTQICGQDARWGACPGLNGQSAEACDGVDNDCDGTVDEGVPGCECVPRTQEACGIAAGVCFPSTRTCGDDGRWGPCPGLARQTDETCDGVDQDCDGRADEALPRCACTPGELRPCGESETGACRLGIQRCVSEADDVAGWTACQGAVLPVDEQCSGRDEDCDGRVDERPECECIPGVSEPCGVDVGVCFRSERVCRPDGIWAPCPGGAAQAPERCDGLDNDCDGRADEAVAVCDCVPGSRRPCGVEAGVCFESTQICGDDARWGPCPGQAARGAETCDGEDEDCDGTADEALPLCLCVPGDARPCGVSDVGACRLGAVRCEMGASEGEADWTACLGRVLPSQEICDGIDNDCNGQTDELEHCECEPGATRQCGRDVGVCFSVFQACSADGRWGLCPGLERQSEERCDGLDNDCDSFTDENLVAPPANYDRGPCEGFVQTCEGPDGWQEPDYGVIEGFAEVEIGLACDGLDNDCNGIVDDGYDKQSDMDHCGACDRRCAEVDPEATGCLAGRCRVVCSEQLPCGPRAGCTFVGGYCVRLDEHYLKASNAGARDAFGVALALSGGRVAVGASSEDGDAQSTADSPNDAARDAGAVYIYESDQGGRWLQVADLKASNADERDLFGGALALDGDTLAVGAEEERGDAASTAANPNDDAPQAGAAYLFEAQPDGRWLQTAYLKASNAEGGDRFGAALALSGSTLVVGAPREDGDRLSTMNAPNNDARDSGAVVVLERQPDLTWQQTAYLKAFNAHEFSRFGEAVAIDGDTLAVGAPLENGAAWSTLDAPNDHVLAAGAVYIFERQPDETWRLTAYLKASHADPADNFGASVALADGRLVVGTPGEDGDARSTADSPTDTAPNSGAAFVFERQPDGTWLQTAYLKAGNILANAGFGEAVALADDRLAVSAWGERGDGDSTTAAPNDNAHASGAVHLFERQPDGRWLQAAYVKASNAGERDASSTLPVALSDAALVMGMVGEDGDAASSLDAPNDALENAGAVYLYTFEE